MKRLEKSEIDALKERLSEWQTPETMHDLLESVLHDLGSSNFFNQGGLAFLRDAWIAAELGSLRGADAVRLISYVWPDFELRMVGHVESFEAVEADHPARRRGDEYKDATEELEVDPVENWIARAEAAPLWLEAACAKKAGKHYGGRASLVIYLNMGEFGIRQAEVEASFAPATKSASEAFETVWVLWKKKAYRVWPEDTAA